jgi:hypothetical protein
MTGRNRQASLQTRMQVTEKRLSLNEIKKTRVPSKLSLSKLGRSMCLVYVAMFPLWFTPFLRHRQIENIGFHIDKHLCVKNS